MLAFMCPYCNDRTLATLDYIVCPSCRGQMRSVPVKNLEHRVSLDKDRDLYVGSLPPKDSAGPTVKVIVPVGVAPQIYEAEVCAVFPTSGMAKRSPLLVCAGDQEFPQPHPQTDRPFTRFFIKGLLYSGVCNVVPFALIRPPVFIFWLSTFAFAGVYYYCSRKIAATCNAANKAIQAQLLVKKNHDPN
jgi:uncharacterized protein YbaR (Trm112 family)